MYIGDYKFQPSKIKKSILGLDVPHGAKLSITDSFDRDSKVFNNYFKRDFKTVAIKKIVKKASFDLNHYKKYSIINFEKEYNRKKTKPPKFSLFIKGLIIEGLLISNALMAANQPSLYGGFMAIIIPTLGMPLDKNNNILWAPFIGMESMAFYNLSIDEKNYSKKEVFTNNLISWHLTMLISYIFEKNKGSIVIAPNKNNFQLAYNYKY